MYQLTLGTYFRAYPEAPGARRVDTSQEVAKAIAKPAREMERECLRMLAHAPMTPDECARLLNSTPAYIRPRFSTLFKLGLIERTGEKRKNASSENGWSHVMRLKPTDERKV